MGHHVHDAGVQQQQGGKVRSAWGTLLLISVLLLSATLLLLHSCRPDRSCSFVTRTTWDFSSLQSRTAQANKIPHSDVQRLDFIIRQAEENGTHSCDQDVTSRVLLFGLPQPKPGLPLLLESGQTYQLLLLTLSQNGSRRCSGGDFFETQLQGAGWRSRPPVTDLGDGSYLVKLHMDAAITGLHTFTAVLLFGNLHGLDHVPDPWVQAKELVRVEIQFVAPSSGIIKPPGQGLHRCRRQDFELREWSGRWTRSTYNQSCTQPEADGHFRCLHPATACDSWCEGPLGSIESNGWVYSAHCKFHLFSPQEAWSCLAGKWLFFWGDSNHQDTIRNLLNFVLGMKEGTLGRTFDATFHNPLDASQKLRITSIFGGHFTESGNNLGLASLFHEPYRHFLESYLDGSKGQEQANTPDALILNSGLHDGKSWSQLPPYLHAADFASSFWAHAYANTIAPKPAVIFRSTVAPAGESRSMPANPHKMEFFNRILTDKFASTPIPLLIVDAYDMTFPWHFDNNCSDGGHYGRPPSLDPWFRQIGHQYFVDVMLAHILLHAICLPYSSFPTQDGKA